MDVLNFLSQMLANLDTKTSILAISAGAAILSIHRNTVIARRRATVDLLLHQRTDEELKAARAVVSPIVHAQTVSDYANKENGGKERSAILVILNNYEFIATGIKHKAFDFNIYREMWFSSLMRDWNAFYPFITDLRSKTEKHKTSFQEFEWLAKKMKKKGLKVLHDK